MRRLVTPAEHYHPARPWTTPLAPAHGMTLGPRGLLTLAEYRAAVYAPPPARSFARRDRSGSTLPAVRAVLRTADLALVAGGSVNRQTFLALGAQTVGRGMWATRITASGTGDGGTTPPPAQSNGWYATLPYALPQGEINYTYDPVTGICSGAMVNAPEDMAQQTGTVRYVTYSSTPSTMLANIKAQLDAAVRGDVVVIPDNAVATAAADGAQIVAPAKAGAGWIYVMSQSAYEKALGNASAMPAEGTRFTKAQHAAISPILETSGYWPILATPVATPTCSHYRFAGVTFRIAPATSADTLNYNLISVGNATAPEDAPEKLPHHFVFDRCLVLGEHGVGRWNAGRGTVRGIAALGRYILATDGEILDIVCKNADSQCINGWNGGQHVECYNMALSASGMSDMQGGSDAQNDSVHPSDWVFIRCLMFKDVGWYAEQYEIKNISEVKLIRRKLVERCILRHCWAGAQAGYAIVLKNVNQYGTGTFQVSDDITYRLLHVDDVGGLANIANTQATLNGGVWTVGLGTHRILFEHIACTRLDQLSQRTSGTTGRLVQFEVSVEGFVWRRTVGFTSGFALYFEPMDEADRGTGHQIEYNVFGTTTYQPGTTGGTPISYRWREYYGHDLMRHNVILNMGYGAQRSSYGPTGDPLNRGWAEIEAAGVQATNRYVYDDFEDPPRQHNPDTGTAAAYYPTEAAPMSPTLIGFVDWDAQTLAGIQITQASRFAAYGPNTGDLITMLAGVETGVHS